MTWKQKETGIRMSSIPKILILSFVGEFPETATQLHQQLKEEVEPAATLEEVTTNLTELANDNFIMSAEKADGTTLFWR